MASLEEVREFWNARPCNLHHSPRPIGSREYFDEVEERKYFVEPHIPRFAEFAKWKNKKVLEIGCGIGTDTVNFARAGAELTAVDLSEASLEIARKRIRIFGLSDRVRFKYADAENLSRFIDPEPYDLIYAFGVLHHSPSPEKILREIRKNFVHSESILKLMLYNRTSFKVFEMAAKSPRQIFHLDRVIAKNSEAQPNCPVTHAFSKRKWKELLTAADFQIEKTSQTHIFPYEIAAYRNYRYIKRPLFRFIPSPAFQQLEKLFGWHWLVDARMR